MLYIYPQLEYAAAVWSLLDVASTSRLESVQRRLTKLITGFYNLFYCERLERLQLTSLALRRELLTVCLIYKVLHNMLVITPECIGLTLCRTSTRTAGIKLVLPRPYCSLFKTSFMYRAANLWNSLPYYVLDARNLYMFKELVMTFWVRKGLGRL
jgi:hypothetical protein